MSVFAVTLLTKLMEHRGERVEAQTQALEMLATPVVPVVLEILEQLQRDLVLAFPVEAAGMAAPVAPLETEAVLVAVAIAGV
jgi:hypothetical protein